MERIAELAQQYGFRVIEDASHAIGARYKGRPVGGCEFSDITVFSFHPVKIITTAEGGLATTQDSQLAQTMSLLRSHGMTREPELMGQAPLGPWYYEQIALGFNYRMTDMQAALGLSQFARLDEFVKRRHEIAARYDGLLRDLPVRTPWTHPDAYSALHLYPVRLDLDRTPRSHRETFELLRERGVGVNLHYIPVHTQPYYRALGFRPGDFPEAERYHAEAISLPMYPTLTGAQQQEVVDTLREVLEA